MNIQKYFPLLALALAACGGGGGGDSAPPEPTPAPTGRVALEIVAGPIGERASLSSDPQRGCTDGAAANAVMGSSMSLAAAADGQSLYTAEQGACDSRFRVRRLDLAAKTVTTLATGADIPAQEAPGPFQLQSFLRPTAIAQAPDGTLAIADSDVFSGGLTTPSGRERQGLGNGVWLLSPTGQLRQLAGFEKPASTPLADGSGPQAVFQSITVICAGAQGEFYVSDLGRVRQISANGAVTTLANAEGRNFEGLYCGQQGRNLTFSVAADGQRKPFELQAQRLFDTPSGVAGLYSAMAGADSAWVSSPAGGTLFLMGLADGRVLPGSTLVTAGLMVAGERYTPNSSALRAANAGVAYLPTAYSIVRLTYQ
ncbi:hypothetical protein AAFF27_10490 [Xylophilus sp. GW821-FHT01B05]